MRDSAEVQISYKRLSIYHTVSPTYFLNSAVDKAPGLVIRLRNSTEIIRLREANGKQKNEAEDMIMVDVVARQEAVGAQHVACVGLGVLDVDHIMD